MDRLRAFEVFVTVVNRGGFARAADALDTSPANVTRYVNELEAHLGTRLLNRTLRAGTLVHVLPEYRLPEIDILAMYPSRRHLSTRVRVMIDFLVDAFGGAPPWDRSDGNWPDVAPARG